MDSQEIAFQGEVMLLQWAESSTRGRTVTLLLNDDADAHPFKDFTIKSGKKSGQRFMCVLVQIDDDEQPVRQTMRNSQLAYLWCNDPSFLEWAKADNHDAARERMLKACGVSSRSELDSGQAAVVFENRIKTPYLDWRKEQDSVSI